MKRSLVFVATTPFAVNAFLRAHLLVLSQTYDITLCVNTMAYPLAEDILGKVRVQHVDIARKIVPWRDIQALIQLLRCFIDLRPSVVHSITPKAGLLAMLAGWLARVPLRFHTFTGQVWATKAGLARCFLKGMDRLIVACSTRVFADSASQCRFLKEEAVIRAGGISVIGVGSVAGVDLKRFHPDETVRVELRTVEGVAGTVPIFLFVGRLVRDKGVFDLIEAFTILSKWHPDAELWMVGPDEDGLQPQMQSLGSQWDSRVRWFGATHNPERYMAAADVLVLPSYREGFGSVVIEAAACGIPTIAYRIDGVVDAVVENETGCLAPVGDVNALAKIMLKLADDRVGRQALGLQALSRVVKCYSSDMLSAAWLELYKEELSTGCSI